MCYKLYKHGQIDLIEESYDIEDLPSYIVGDNPLQVLIKILKDISEGGSISKQRDGYYIRLSRLTVSGVCEDIESYIEEKLNVRIFGNSANVNGTNLLLHCHNFDIVVTISTISIIEKLRTLIYNLNGELIFTVRH